VPAFRLFCEAFLQTARAAGEGELVIMTKQELEKFLHELEHKDDPLLRWERGKPQRAAGPDERHLDTELTALIDRRVEALLTEPLQAFRDLLGEGMAAVNVLASSLEKAREDDWRKRSDELSQLRVEACEKEAKVQAAVADLYRLIATLGAAPVDRPSLPGPRRVN
jgi:hypothetical protein